jgi:hypothetical protein
MSLRIPKYCSSTLNVTPHREVSLVASRLSDSVCQFRLSTERRIVTDARQRVYCYGHKTESVLLRTLDSELLRTLDRVNRYGH